MRRRESRFAGEDEIAFRHALLREGAYAMLTERDRALGHALAGAWLDEHGERDPMVLARHFQLGGDEARAGVFYLQAAEQALHGTDLGVAVAHAEAALACGVAGEPRGSPAWACSPRPMPSWPRVGDGLATPTR